MNPYLDQLYATLPSLFAQFDTDPYSPTRGVGDRLHWAWKLIDFPNGTMQGSANGIARLYHAGLLPDEFRQGFFKRLDDIFHGTDLIRRPNGSMEEAFPYESSFCVTALVAFDLLTALELSGDQIPSEAKSRYLKAVEPMIGFLHRADETHGFISNHLATAAAALFKWTLLTQGKGEERGSLFLNRILSRQSPEGWYPEYEGADPGYQTLCMHYLADLDRLRPDLGLGDSLKASVRFLWNFAHPDGSFGGYYGSRNTRFYYPSGIRYLAAKCPEAAALDRFMTAAIGRKAVVSLATMDPPNLTPMFNSYAWAAALEAQMQLGSGLPVPCEEACNRSTDFPASGLHIRSSATYYTVISSNKGGIVAHYDRTADSMHWDCGVVAEDRDGNRFTSQWYRDPAGATVEERRVVVTSALMRMNHRVPTPFDFLILRLMNLTAMRLSFFSNLVKRLLVWLLITRKDQLPAAIQREVVPCDDGKVLITDTWATGSAEQYKLLSGGLFRATHMASSGYWQRGDL